MRVHKSALLGEENKGWRVGSMGLNLDRVGAARYLISVRRDEDIVNWIKKTVNWATTARRTMRPFATRSRSCGSRRKSAG